MILKALFRETPGYDIAVNKLSTAISGVPYVSGVDDPGYLLCLVTFGLGVILYTAYGGFRAVVWTDVMQGIVMVGGVVIMLPLAIYFAGGLGNATNKMAEMTPPAPVFLKITLDAPSAGSGKGGNAAETIPKGTWLTIPATPSTPQRLFRTAKRSQ